MSTPANPLRNPYFGELHVHTAWSLDAFVIASLNGPDEAFRFAKGEPARSSLNNAEQTRLSRPLDFAAVTEHAEWLGEYGLIVDPDYNPEDPAARAIVDRYRATRVPGQDGRAGDVHAMVEVVISGMVRPDPTRLPVGELKEVLDAGRTIWRRIVEIAASHNDPGRFTTLNGFEWTPTPGGVNFHRVIIFRGDDVPDLPLSNYEATHPEQLWDWLETAAGGPDNAVAITHNANFSNGQMFNPRYSDGREIDEAYARRRALWEPLAEMFQSKGSSETTPAVSPHDPFAGFEIVACQAFAQLAGASGAASRPDAVGHRAGRPGGGAAAAGAPRRQPVPGRVRRRQRRPLRDTGQQRGQGLDRRERLPR